MHPILILFLLAGCGYQFDNYAPKKTVYVPFVEGDLQGEMTTKLIYLLNTSGKFIAGGPDSRYCLAVSLIGYKDQNVGFRYDRDSEGNMLNNTIIPAESRFSVLSEIILTDRTCNCTLLGPARISASLDFDHDWYSTWDGINVFSLGQITDYADAKDQVSSPLYQKLAQKIVDLLIQL